MKKYFIFAFAALLASVVMSSCGKDPKSNPDYSSTLDAEGERGVGALPGIFTVGRERAVCFSQGNLQYFADVDTHSTADNQRIAGSWRFAANQYDYRGFDNVTFDSAASNIVDLFGWGTSGWVNSANASSPRSCSVVSSDYTPSRNPDANLTGDNAYADWGLYNAIANGGDAPGLWRTLSSTEWSYIFHQRENTRVGTTSNIRFAKGQVHGINGMLLFPDKYRHPDRVAIPVEINMMDGNFTKNHYDGADWDSLQAAGVVFLPAAGMRYGTDVSKVHTAGNYWSCTSSGKNEAFYLSFMAGSFDASTFGYRCNGRAVRLVQDVKVK